MLYIIIIVLFIALSLGSFYYTKIIMKKAQDPNFEPKIMNGLNLGSLNQVKKKDYKSPDKPKFLEIEAQYPVPVQFKDLMGFGMISINSGLETNASRSLHIKGSGKGVRYELKRFWEITDKASLLSTVNHLQQMPNVEQINIVNMIDKKIAATLIDYDESEDKVSFAQGVANAKSSLHPIIRELYEILVEKIGIPAKDFLSVKSIAAWDIDHIAMLARKSVQAGFIDDEECFEIMKRAQVLALQTFDNWESYISSFVLGRGFCYKSDDYYQLEEAVGALYTTPTSILHETEHIWKNK